MAATERTKPIKNEEVDDDDDDGIQENQFLTFGIASETYGINILQVMEIIRLVKITPIPETLAFIKGVINLRGKIIPVMDVRLRFNLASKDFDDRTCIVVVNIRDLEIGLIVDHVSEVLEIPAAHIEPMPTVNQSSHQRFVKGIGKMEGEVKILLDLDKLLFDEEIDQLKKV